MTHANPLFMTYNSPPIICFFCLCLYYLIKRLFGSDEEEEEEDNQLVEGLAEYYDALKHDDVSIIRGQEEYYKYNFGIKTYSD